MAKCRYGHSDFYTDGECRICAHNHQAKYRARRRAAMEFAKAFERAGQLDLSAYVTPPPTTWDDN